MADIKQPLSAGNLVPALDPAGYYSQGQGKTTIAPEVLVTIARLTTLGVEGVSRMSSGPEVINRVFRRDSSEGVQLEIHGESVTADLYVVVKPNINMREVSRNIQHSVSRAISDMVGMEVGRINIHIEDIDFPG